MLHFLTIDPTHRRNDLYTKAPCRKPHECENCLSFFLFLVKQKKRFKGGFANAETTVDRKFDKFRVFFSMLAVVGRKFYNKNV